MLFRNKSDAAIAATHMDDMNENWLHHAILPPAPTTSTAVCAGDCSQ